MENLRWIASAALSAYAGHLAVGHATPIDRALPILAVAVTFVAYLTRFAPSSSALMLAVPLLIAAEVALPEESMRLLTFGAIIAACVGVALIQGARLARGADRSGLPSEGMAGDCRGSSDDTWSAAGTSLVNVTGATPHPPSAPSPLCGGEKGLDVCSSRVPSPRDPSPPRTGEKVPEGRMRGLPRGGRGGSASLGITVVALVLLRWIPFANVLLLRELILLALAVAIVIVLGRTPLAVTVAVITALATPAVPLRTLALPAAVLLVAIAARLFGAPRISMKWPSTIVMMFVMLFFPWSGIVGRALPYFLQRGASPKYRLPIAQALAPNQSATYEVPDGARMLVVSGANVAGLRRGAILGRVDPGGMAVRIGDAADWGYMRRENFYAARNPLPRDPAGKIRDYGYAAWVDGAGRIALPRGARRIRVTASENLSADASLQVEGFE